MALADDFARQFPNQGPSAGLSQGRFWREAVKEGGISKTKSSFATEEMRSPGGAVFWVQPGEKDNMLAQGWSQLSSSAIPKGPSAAEKKAARELANQKLKDAARAAERKVTGAGRTEAAYRAGGGYEAEAKQKAAAEARGIYADTKQRAAAEKAQRDMEAANKAEAADKAKKAGTSQRQLDLKAYSMLNDTRGIYAKYLLGQRTSKQVYERLGRDIQARTTVRIKPDELNRLVNAELTRLQTSPYFEGYKALAPEPFNAKGMASSTSYDTSGQYTPEQIKHAYPSWKPGMPMPDMETDAVQASLRVLSGLAPIPAAVPAIAPLEPVKEKTMEYPKGLDTSKYDQIDAWLRWQDENPTLDPLSYKPVSAQEAQRQADMKRRPDLYSVESGGTRETVPGVGIDYGGGDDFGAVYQDEAAGRQMIERDRLAQEAKARAERIRIQDAEMADEEQDRPYGYYDPTGVGGGQMVSTYTPPPIVQRPFTEPPLTSTGTYQDVGGAQSGIYAREVGRRVRPGADYIDEFDTGDKGKLDSLLEQNRQLGELMLQLDLLNPDDAILLKQYQNQHAMRMKDIERLRASLYGGDALNPRKDYREQIEKDRENFRKQQEWEREQARRAALGLSTAAVPPGGGQAGGGSPQVASAAGARTDSAFDISASKYGEGYFGKPGAQDSFAGLYEELYTRAAAIEESVLGGGANLDDQRYSQNKLKVQNEVMAKAQGIRDRYLSSQSLSELQSQKQVPRMQYEAIGATEEGVDALTGARLLRPGGSGSGLGYNADTIRSNLNMLPPGDDRRGALTEVLMMYEKFEAQVAQARTATEAATELEELRQGFESTERQLRDTLSREDRAQDQQIQREIDTWQRGQAKFLQEFNLNLQKAQMEGRWDGSETLERTRLEHQNTIETEALKQTGQRQTFEQEMRTGQLALDQTRAEAEAKRDEWQIGRERRDWEGEQNRLNAVLTGYLDSPENQTLAAQEFGWAKILEEADRTGLFGEDKIETLAFKNQKFQEGLAQEKQKNAARLEEIKLEMNENDNETKLAVADRQVAIEQGKLDDAVKARRVQMSLEQDKLDFQKTQMRLEAMQSLSNPKTLLMFQRTGMIPMLERILGMSLNMPTFPELLPPGQTIPTQQYLNMASPGDRELIMAEASLRSGYSDMDVRSVLQRQMPGGLGVAIGYRGEGR